MPISPFFKNLFLFTLGSTAGFTGSNFFLQKDIYSTSAVIVERLDSVYSQLSDISQESRLVESKCKEVSRELDMLVQSKNNEIEQLKQLLQEERAKQQIFNNEVKMVIQQLEGKTDGLLRMFLEENPAVLERLRAESEEEEEL